MTEMTHFDESGRARMVDVTEKAPTSRIARAGARVWVNRETFEKIVRGGLAKGDVLGTAQIAGIMAAKRTSDLIPMCHPLALTGVALAFFPDEATCVIDIEATVRCKGETGVEMEALTCVSAAALTIYDMCKAVQKDIVIGEIRLLYKDGGKSGEYVREEEANGK